ncbi:MAG: carbon starvation protein A [Candidatus Aureabacteria bacterium]|nr:carbon starvation protein A [Candidatus Auribacterota bacterium]
MNGALLIIIGITFFLISYRIYGRYITGVFNIEESNETPAHKLSDGVDYVPTKFPVLFGHHFASIAGAGPIVGPVLGVCFGWGPVALWIILGCVFIGAVHDLTTLIISVRNEGRSIGHIVEKYIGFSGRQIFLLFCFATLLLVVAIFSILISKIFVASPSVATSSIIFILMAPCFGYLVYKKNLSLLKGSLFFVPLLFFGIYLGTVYPLNIVELFGVTTSLARQIWILVLFVYVFIASVSPVWLLLQPRDYLNSYLLYIMIILGFISILFVAPAFKMPAFVGFVVDNPQKGELRWALFPILYVTIACGACSGFHALVSSGTTSKQISSEKHILPIGYGAMLVEGILALMALISVSVLTQSEFISLLGTKGPVYAFANGLAGFMDKIGISFNIGYTFVALTISAFMLTTLDTATRLTRFTLQEICLPKNKLKYENKVATFLGNRYVAAFIVVFLSGYLALSGDGIKIWPVFGASNQLLAALSLLVVTVIMISKKMNYWIVLLPFLFMIFMSLSALWTLFIGNIIARNWPLVIATFFLLLLSIILVISAVFTIKKKVKA